MTPVQFAPNVPVDGIALETHNPWVPRHSWDSRNVNYSLTDGRVMSVPPSVAASIRQMEIQPGEKFAICRRWNGDPDQVERWDIWLMPETEMARALIESPGMATREAMCTHAGVISRDECPYCKPVNAVRNPSPVTETPLVHNRVLKPVVESGGAVPLPSPLKTQSRRQSVMPSRVSCAVAFGECLRIVVQSLVDLSNLAPESGGH